MIARIVARTSACLLSLVAAVACGEAQAQNFDGPGTLKFGVFAQAARTSLDVSEQSTIFPGLATDNTGSIRGFGGGVSLGYDWSPYKTWMLGLEADGSVDEARTDINLNQFNTQFLMTLRARAGVYLRPNILVYGTGGYALLGMKYSGDNGGLDVRTRVSATLDGYVVGGGLEMNLTDMMIFTAEYLHTGLNTWKYTGASSDPFEIKADQDIVRLGIKFKIGYDYY